METHIIADWPGNLVIIGFGSVGQGALPLILRHIDVDRTKMVIVTGDERGRSIAEREKIPFKVQPLNRDNFRTVLTPLLGEGGFLLNLSVDVSSTDLITFCHERGALYLDAAIEPWLEGYADPKLSMLDRSNYRLREDALALKPKLGPGPTAVLACGANPGVVSHFLKRALLEIAKDTGHDTATPRNRAEWSALAQALGVKTVHISEYDSQVANVPKQIGRFENTWSSYGFHAEAINQPSEMGWGTHEKEMPAGASHYGFGCESGIYLDRPGALTFVRSWAPSREQFMGRLVTHHESLAIADFYSLKDGDGTCMYRPTVHYAYRPCDAALLSLDESLGNNSRFQKKEHILLEEITQGMDELGVLIMGHAKGAYWYGSQLTIEDARRLAPYQNATGLQVTAGVLSGMIWAMENPKRGVAEPDDIDFERAMQIIEPYMGKMTGVYTDWTPLKGRDEFFPKTVAADPWQFKNFLIR